MILRERGHHELSIVLTANFSAATGKQHWATYQLKYYGRNKRYDNTQEQDSDNKIMEDSGEEDQRIDLGNDDSTGEVSSDGEDSDDEDDMENFIRKRGRVGVV